MQPPTSWKQTQTPPSVAVQTFLTDFVHSVNALALRLSQHETRKNAEHYLAPLVSLPPARMPLRRRAEQLRFKGYAKLLNDLKQLKFLTLLHSIRLVDFLTIKSTNIRINRDRIRCL